VAPQEIAQAAAVPLLRLLPRLRRRRRERRFEARDPPLKVSIGAPERVDRALLFLHGAHQHRRQFRIGQRQLRARMVSTAETTAP